MCSATPSIQPRTSSCSPPNKSGGAICSGPAWRRARFSRLNRCRATGQLHHGTSSIRRSTASTSPSGARKRPRSTVENTSRFKMTPLCQRSTISLVRVMASSAGGRGVYCPAIAVSFGGSHPRAVGGPAVLIGESPQAERLFLGDGFFRPAQPLAFGIGFWVLRQRRKQAEIYVHRLKRTRAGIDGLHVPAGDVREQRPMRRGRRRRRESLAETLRGGCASGDKADCG